MVLPSASWQDFGYPQISEVKVLKEYITQGAHKLAVAKPPQVPQVNLCVVVCARSYVGCSSTLGLRRP